MTARGADRFPPAVERAALAVAVVAAVAVWALAPTYPNYDAYYHLVWGRELLDGLTPSFEAYAAPTKHPLYVALAALLGLLGESADRALVLVAFLSHALLVLGAYRLGAAVFGRWPGALGALFVAGSASFLLYSARAYVDMPFLALVVWAGVLVAEGRATGAPLALLTVAGLLRPEAWVLAGLLWLVEGRGSVRLVALAAVAPVAWVLVDLVATGDPLHSLHATSDLADDLGRERGVGAVPGSFVSFLAATVRPPVAVLGVLGMALAVRLLGWRRARVPLALAAAGAATFLALGLTGLSILPRYLTVPAVALCVFAGYALLGFTALPADHRARERWRRASMAAALAGVVVLALLAPSLGRVTEELRFLRATHDGLVDTLDHPRVRDGRRCGPVTFPTYRLVPDARWHLDAPRAAVGARSARRRPAGVALFLVTRKGLRRYGLADGASPTTNVPDTGYRRIVVGPRFSAYLRCTEDASSVAP